MFWLTITTIFFSSLTFCIFYCLAWYSHVSLAPLTLVPMVIFTHCPPVTLTVFVTIIVHVRAPSYVCVSLWNSSQTNLFQFNIKVYSNCNVFICRWDIKTLLKKIPKLGAVIDLTNTSRYYDPRVSTFDFISALALLFIFMTVNKQSYCSMIIIFA